MQRITLTHAQQQSLTRIWQSVAQTGQNGTSLRDQDIRQVYELGLGLQEVLQHLYGDRPDLPQFLEWVDTYGHHKNELSSLQEDVLSADDLDHWHQSGYVVIRNAVTADEREAASRAIWEFLQARPDDPESWYLPHAAKNGLMVVFTQHPALETIRRSPRIRRAYEQLYGTTAIYRVVDKVSFNPPETDGYRFAGSPLHWDTSLVSPIPYRLQGLLYLSDVSAEGGAFKCVPGFHRQIEAWLDQVPEGVDPRLHAMETLKPMPVPGQAGDFIIWHQALPHGASANHGLYPRLVQYLTYLPEDLEDDRAWI